MSLAWWRQHLGKFWLAGVYGFFYLPLAFLVVFSFNSTRQDSVFTGFSLRWYQALVNDSRLVDGFFLSLKVAFLSATLGTVLATLAAYALVRFGAFRGRSLFNAMLASPLVMPEVIIGMSLLLLFVGMERLLGWPPGRGTLTIVLGHALLGMAYASVVIQSRLKDMDRSIEEAALDLGCRPFQVFFLVTLPNMSQALIAAWLLTFTWRQPFHLCRCEFIDVGRDYCRDHLWGTHRAASTSEPTFAAGVIKLGPGSTGLRAQ